MTMTDTTDPAALGRAPFPVAVLVCGECGLAWQDHIRLASTRDPAVNGYDWQALPTLAECIQLLKQVARP